MVDRVDLFDLDSNLSDDERAVRDLARDFVKQAVKPRAGELWEQGVFPREWIAQLGELGFLGCNLPEAYGGAGLNNVAYGLIMQELEAGDSGIRSFASVQGSLVMYPIFAYGSEEQKRAWLPKLAKGEAVGCFGLTEPNAGSDPGRMTTRVRKDGGEWVITGRKMWITNGSIADVAVIWAYDEQAQTVRGFLVEAGTPGFSAQDIKHKLSMRLSVTSELSLDEVRVPDRARLPGVEGLRGPLSCLTQARYGIAWGANGAARDCYEEALDYAGRREAFGASLSSFQLIQQRLVDILTELVKAQLLALQLGRLKDAGRLHYSQVSLAKRNNVRMALETARAARTILGAVGITGGYASMRHAANLETVDTYEGTYDIHTLIIGREITGKNAFLPPAGA